MKKLTLILWLLLSTTICTFAYDFKSGDLYYNITSDSTVEVTYQEQYSDYNYSGLTSAIIPESVTYNGTTYRVTSIGGDAFCHCSSLMSVTIPSGVISIGYGAFGDCGELMSVVWNAKNYADFAYNSTPFYSANWDLRSQITSFTFGDSVKHVPAYICNGMNNLTSVTIGKSVTSIGEGAFYGCSSLMSVTIPSGVISIGYGAFGDCGELMSVVWNAKNYADFAYNSTPFYSANWDLRSQITSFTFGDSVKHVPAYICNGMNNLTSVTIGKSVTSIGGEAFSGCTGLTSVTIPNSVTSIGGEAFVRVPNIVYSGMAGGAPWGARCMNGYVDGYLVYSDATKTTLLACSSAAIGDITIPNSVTGIGSSAFSGCSGLTSVTIPNSVTSIGGSAFYGCSGLTSVVWNAKNYADFTNDDTPFYYTDRYRSFDLRSQITSFVFGDSVQHIPANMCNGMNNLTSVTIGNNVTSIGYGAFYGCSGLTKTNYTGDIAGWFNITGWSYSISYETANPIYYSHNFFINDVLVTDLVIPEGITTINDAFRFDTCLTSVTIPNSVTSIGGEAFWGCTGLESVTIGNSVTSIGYDAFYGCSGLTKTNYTGDIAGWLNITGWSYSISYETANPIYYSHNFFINDVLVKDLVIPEGITTINDAFRFDTCLTSVTIPSSIDSICSNAFNGCNGLTSVQWNAQNYADFTNDDTPFYNKGSYYDSNGFDLRSQITSFTFGDSVKHIPAYICNGMNNLTSVTIGKSVTSIGEDAFYGCSGLTKTNYKGDIAGWYNIDYGTNANPIRYSRNFFINDVLVTDLVIPEGITKINDAFRFDTCIASVTIPNSIDSIGTNAFGNCDNLASVVWKTPRCTGWNDYKSSPFYSEKGSNITSFSFGKEVKSIPNYLCYEMKNLTSVVIPNSVDSIGNEAFRNCRALISVAMGKNVTYIGYRAFDGTYWLNNQRDGLIYMNTILYGYKGVMPRGTEVIVREGTTEIGHHALAGCTGLTAITIPNSVTNIQDSAFYDCSSLDSITIPASVTTIGQYAFSACGNLTFAAIGSNVARIGQNAFGGCDNLTSVVWNSKYYRDLSSDLETPFYDARQNITSFIFGNEVEHIPAYLCNGMSRLDSIIIPASVTSIGGYAFNDCRNLAFVVIPSSVTHIGNSAFAGCSGLTKTNYTGDVAGWYRMRFDDRQSNPIEYSRNLFLSDVLVTDLVVPADLDTINDAFSRDTCLISVVIPDGVKAIGETAFYDCTGLTDISISGTVNSIGKRAFQNCYSLNSLAIPDGVMTIGESAFADCSGLTDVSISNSVISIGERAFQNCYSLNSLAIPNSVTTIGNNAFANCTGLSSLFIPNSVTNIESSAFYGCRSLISVTIPGSIKSIAPSLFSGCTSLSSVIISDGVTSVGDEAFRGCTGLTYVTCYATEPPSVSSNAFYGVKVDTIPLYVPMESMVKYNSSAVWKDFLVLPISAMPVDIDEPVLDPEDNKVTITWPSIEDAIAYTIEISNDSALVCTLVFDAGGALRNIRYAGPAHHAPQRATHAETTGYGFRFVVEGLDYATTYTYTITATDMEDVVLTTYTGSFTTKDPNPATDTEDIRSTQSHPATRKVFRDGQVYIIRGDKTYTLTGEEVK